MHVLHVVSGDLWAGAEVQAFTLLRELSNVPGLKVSAVVLNRGELHARLCALGIPVTLLDEQSHHSLAIGRRLRAVVSDLEPDILHSHRYKENILSAAAVGRARRPRLVRTVHGLTESFTFFKGVKAGLYGWLDRQVSRHRFDRIICVSEEMRTRLAGVYRPHQLACIRNGLDAERCRPSRDRQDIRRELGLQLEQPVLGYAGRLVAIKGLEYLLEVCTLLRAEVPGLRLLLVGDGPEKVGLEQWTRDRELDNVVQFTGHRTDAHDLIHAMDVFVLPSLSEGIPMVILEAMALGTPVVASRVGGLPEILDDRKTGLLVPSGDAQALARACAELLAQPERARALADAASEAVRTLHSARTMCEKTMSLYRAVLEAVPAASRG